MRGTLYLSACRHTVSVCGSTPETASRMAMAPSRTRSERSTSMVKSTWPGVSMMLMRQSRQKEVVAADGMVIPRSCSWSIHSVVVVLPASMWAMMPMFRVFSSGYCSSTTLPSPLLGATQEKRGVEAPAPLFESRSLPAIVRERLVGLRHLVSVFALLDGRPAVVGRVQQLTGEPLRHALLRAAPRGPDQPAHAEGR